MIIRAIHSNAHREMPVGVSLSTGEPPPHVTQVGGLGCGSRFILNVDISVQLSENPLKILDVGIGVVKGYPGLATRPFALDAIERRFRLIPFFIDDFRHQFFHVAVDRGIE